MLALAFYVPVVTGLLARPGVAPHVGGARRPAWWSCSSTLAVLQDRDALPLRVPDIGMLLVPVALGLALAAACAVAVVLERRRRRTFGWRQPLGVLSMAAVLVGDRSRRW